MDEYIHVPILKPNLIIVFLTKPNGKNQRWFKDAL